MDSLIFSMKGEFKMQKPDVKAFISNTKKTLSKHSPEILTAIGIAGMLTTTVLAVKATPKALRLIEKAEDHGIGITSKDGDPNWEYRPLTPIETVKVAWKPYIPAVITGVTSTACLIGANSVNAKRNAALATAYKMTETALSEYKEKVIETIGEKKERAIKDKIAKDKIDNNPVNSAQVIVTGTGTTRFYDAAAGRYFISDMEKIKRAVNDLNKRMLSEMYISWNEFYMALDLEPIDMGDTMGWNIHEEGFIELDWSSQICDDGTPCIVMSYLVAPKYGFDRLM